MSCWANDDVWVANMKTALESERALYVHCGRWKNYSNQSEVFRSGRFIDSLLMNWKVWSWKINRHQLKIWWNGRKLENNTYRYIIDRPWQICGWLRELAWTISLELITRPVPRHNSIDKRLGIWYFYGMEKKIEWKSLLCVQKTKVRGWRSSEKIDN